MFVSVLIPLYNGIEFLDESISSVKYQTHKNWEIIIGINGHPENSNIYLQAKQYQNNKIRVLEFLSTKGKSQTLNEMIKYSKYDIICLLDVDDKWLPSKLEEQIKIKKDYDIVGTMCQYFGRRKDVPTIPIGLIDNNNILKANPIINSSCMINKIDAKWNDEFVEDYDMWIRLAYEDKKFYNINKILTLHRIHRKSFFNNTNNNYTNSLISKWKTIYKNKRV